MTRPIATSCSNRYTGRRKTRSLKTKRVAGNTTSPSPAAAALGLAQLKRYPDLLARRRELVTRYEAGLANEEVELLSHFEGDPDTDGYASSAHLMLGRLTGKGRVFRDALIERLAHKGVASNVHYKPLPLLTAYRNLGFDIADFPHALAQFENEITLPLHTKLSDDDVDYIVEQFCCCKAQLEAEGTA